MTSNGNFEEGKNLLPEALETPIECAHCHAKIPQTVAFSFEGADYLYHFCGWSCFEAWRKAPAAHDK